MSVVTGSQPQPALPLVDILTKVIDAARKNGRGCDIGGRENPVSWQLFDGDRGRLLVIAPHADDEVLGAGGLLGRANREGWETSVAVARIEASCRWDELQESCRILGSHAFMLDTADEGWLDVMPLARLVSAIEDVLNQFQPTVVVIPDFVEVHQEHRAVAEAAMAALRPGAATDRWRPPVVLTFEHLADAWAMQQVTYPPTLWVKLEEEDLRLKLKAMAAHVSQMRPAPSERSLESIEALARVRGSQAGCGAAECFSIIRWLV